MRRYVVIALGVAAVFFAVGYVLYVCCEAVESWGL